MRLDILRSPVDLELSLPRGEVSGRVVDADGEPLAGFLVTVEDEPTRIADPTVLEHAWTTTRPDGTFELAHLPRRTLALVGGPPGPFAEGVGPVGTAWGRIRVDPSRGGQEAGAVELRVPRAGSARGLPRDAAGHPLKYALVYARALDEPPWAMHVVGRTDATGVFRSSGLPAGEVELWAAGRGETTSRIAVRVSAGETVDVELFGVPSATLEVLAAMPGGDLLGFRAQLLDREGRVLRQGGPLEVMTFAHVIEAVPLGDYRLRGWDAEGKEWTADVALESPGRHPVTLSEAR